MRSWPGPEREWEVRRSICPPADSGLGFEDHGRSIQWGCSMKLHIRLAVAFVLFTSAASHAVVCVDPDNANCEATIQAGVDAAAADEVVQVAPGLYNEEVTIGTAGVILRGSRG